MDILLKTAPAYDKLKIDNLLSPENVQVPFLLDARLRDDSSVHWKGEFPDLGCLPVIAMYGMRLPIGSASSSAPGDAMLLRANDFPSSARDHFEVGHRFFYRQIQAFDAPEHTKHRSLIAKAFTPRVMEGIRESVQQRVDYLIQRMKAAGECDFVAEFAVAIRCLLSSSLICLAFQRNTTTP